MRLWRSTSTVLGLCLCLATTATAPPCAASPDDSPIFDPARSEVEGAPDEASVHGKYHVLLRRIHCPEDLPSYKHFTDYGMFTGTAWHNYTNLPPGYWVYVYPDWYIWRDSTDAPQMNAPIQQKKAKE